MLKTSRTLSRLASTAAATIGSTADATRTAVVENLEKATMNVTRYTASGAIQSSGAEAMSVEIQLVTPSSRLDGMNASRIQRSRVRALSAGAVARVETGG